MGPHLEWINASLAEFAAELFLAGGIVILLLAGLIRNSNRTSAIITLIVFAAAFLSVSLTFDEAYMVALFHGMVQNRDAVLCFKLMFIGAGILTVLMSLRDDNIPYRSEYYALIVAIVLGANLLAMSVNFIMVFISMEVISISSYVLAGFSFNRKGAEGSLKYFLFGSVASAIMLYGFSILYGYTGTLDFSYAESFTGLATRSLETPLVVIAALMVTGGFLYKIVAVPMHPWSPDVYEAAPMPVIALFSVVPKIAGVVVFFRFVHLMNAVQPDRVDWKIVIGVIALLTLTVGNFSALLQKNAKRMMAYSSIAQAGFLLIAIASPASLLPNLIFYSVVYLVMNYVVFLCLQSFERSGIDSIERFSGVGKSTLFASLILLVGLIALTGLPPTAGFTGKLLIFSSLWTSFDMIHGGLAGNFWIILMIIGLLNTVVSLFFYLKIPYYAFLKTGEPIEKQNILTFENLLGLFLVLVLLALFFQPGLLMGWINKFIFVA